MPLCRDGEAGAQEGGELPARGRLQAAWSELKPSAAPVMAPLGLVLRGYPRGSCSPSVSEGSGGGVAGACGDRGSIKVGPQVILPGSCWVARLPACAPQVLAL